MKRSNNPNFHVAGRAAKEIHKRRRIALFAEALSEVGEIKAAARLSGVGLTAATAYMRQMRDELGWQAQ